MSCLEEGGGALMAFRRLCRETYNCIKAEVCRANEAAGYSCGDEKHAIWFTFNFGGFTICVKHPRIPSGRRHG